MSYDDVAAEYDEWVAPVLDDPTFDELVGDVRGLRVIAVACGQGREARRLASRGAQVVGVDISSKLLDTAARYDRTGITYVHADVQRLEPFDDGSFDAAVCHMALMDIPDLTATLRSVARVLKSTAWFVFSITHPCYKTPAAGEIVDNVDGSVRRTVGRYFDEGYWDGPGKDFPALPVGAHHRTLSTYVNTLTDAGFIIERFNEPKLGSPVWQEVPCLLYVRARR